MTLQMLSQGSILKVFSTSVLVGIQTGNLCLACFLTYHCTTQLLPTKYMILSFWINMYDLHWNLASNDLKWKIFNYKILDLI